MQVHASNIYSGTLEKVQDSMKQLLLSESLKQMKLFPASSLTPNSFGQSAFESFLIDEYSKSIAPSMKFDFELGTKK